MAWVFFALIATLSTCMVADWNRKHKYEIFALNFWRCIISILVLAPVCFMKGWPTDTTFYIVCVFIGIGSGICMLAIFYLSAKFNGRISTIYSCIAMVMTFLAWIAIDSEAQKAFLENGLNSVFISLCILIACISLFYMRSMNKMEKQGYLLFSFVIATVNAVVSIIGKVSLPSSASDELGIKVLIMGFIIFIVQFIMSFFLTLYLRIKTKSPTFHFKKHVNFSVAFLGFLGALGCVTSWAAIALAPNPAFPKAIGMSVPVLLLIFHKWKKIEDKANPIAGTALAISVILIVLLQ